MRRRNESNRGVRDGGKGRDDHKIARWRHDKTHPLMQTPIADRCTADCHQKATTIHVLDSPWLEEVCCSWIWLNNEVVRAAPIVRYLCACVVLQAEIKIEQIGGEDSPCSFFGGFLRVFNDLLDSIYQGPPKQGNAKKLIFCVDPIGRSQSCYFPLSRTMLLAWIAHMDIGS